MPVMTRRAPRRPHPGRAADPYTVRASLCMRRGPLRSAFMCADKVFRLSFWTLWNIPLFHFLYFLCLAFVCTCFVFVRLLCRVYLFVLFYSSVYCLLLFLSSITTGVNIRLHCHYFTIILDKCQMKMIPFGVRAITTKTM